MLRTPSTIGYEDLGFIVVNQVNGKKINNIADLSAALRQPNGQGLHKIEFEGYPNVIYIDDRVSQIVNQQLIQYGINQLERLD